MATPPATLRQLRQRARARFTDPDRRGFLIAFEGPDGSGKTTQRKLFKTWLQTEGYEVVTTKWNSSELIKPIIKARKSVQALSPEEFSLLHAADFRHRVEHTVLPALWAVDVVMAWLALDGGRGCRGWTTAGPRSDVGQAARGRGRQRRGGAGRRET